MRQTDLDNPEARLRALLDELDAEDAQGEADQATVMLDQASVGRLSRMDALQRQAMAQATARRRDGERTRILAALKRVEDGEYGYCTDCGDDIAPARLAANPAIPRCLSCAQG
ncbi:MAG: TraR/DksA C4-type zinc finger protein [Pseudomonadota bacterium]